MKGRQLKISKLKLSSILLFVIGWLGFLGSLEITAIGLKIYVWLQKYVGEFAWIVPFILMILAVIGWFSTSQPLFYSSVAGKKQSTRKQPPARSAGSKNRSDRDRTSSSERTRTTSSERTKSTSEFELPAGKLVSLQGFKDYFASSDLDLQTAATREDLLELGSDFDTYFQKKPFKTNRVESVNGFREYFRSDPASSAEEHWETEAKAIVKTMATAKVTATTTSTGQERTPLADFKQDQAEKWKAERRMELNNAVTERAISEKNAPVMANEEQPDGDNPDLAIDEVNEQQQETAERRETAEKQKSLEKQETVEEQEKTLTGYPGQVAQLVQQRQEAKTTRWQLPDVSLLQPPVHKEDSYEEDEENIRTLEEVLLSFGIKCQVVNVSHGPVITRYELVPAPGVKISRIVNLADDMALALAARDVRIEAPIPGKSAIGIEVPNKEPRTVSFREVIESPEYQRNPSLLKVALGKDISGKPVIADLAKMPHLLVAGATGSGKSVCVNTIINSILYNARPEEVKLMLIDPKMVELSNFNGIPHLLTPVVTDSKAAASFLKWAVKEMETRYELFAANGVRDISSYNALMQQRQRSGEINASPLPLIVIVIDELADLMMVSANDVEEAICRLAQMARAAGMHLLIATQRPSVDVITGVIKANIPSRIAFAVTSQIDSRTILDSAGAERLLGKGDMLFSPIGLNKPMRVQGCFIDDEEARQVIEHWKRQGKPEYLAPETFISPVEEDSEAVVPGDELFMEAAKLVITTEMASVSFLQRKFKIGYARAARLIDLLEEEGIVGGYEGSKPRKVLMNLEQFMQRFPESAD